MSNIDLSEKTVLLTNDDGIDGAGLISLEKTLSSFGATVCVLAPSSNQSGVSSKLTMKTPLSFCRVKKSEKSEWISCSGTPVDCVISALLSPIFGQKKFDAVISGINKGANLGTDVIYSGTCAAARQATLYGFPGIALSVESYDNTWKFDALSEFCAKNLEKLISLCTSDVFVSVNASSADIYNGVGFASPSIRDYRDRMTIVSDPNGRNDVFYGFFGEGLIQSARRRLEQTEDDCSLSKRGFISVTRFFAEPAFLDEGGSSF